MEEPPEIPDLSEDIDKNMEENEEFIGDSDDEQEEGTDDEKSVKLKRDRKGKKYNDREKKRGPGRPRINKPYKKIPRNGIIQKPTISGNIKGLSPELEPVVELLYENPFLFKKIFSLFKNMGSGNCNIIFEKQRVVFFTKDHLAKSTVYAVIHCDRINSYYRAEPLTINLPITNIQKVLQTINKGYGKITLYTTRQFKNKSITMVIHDDELDGDSVCEFEINSNEIDTEVKDINQILESEETYPIKIEMAFKAFKRKINELLPLSERVRFEKNGTQPLYIQLNFGDSRGKQKFRFSNAGKVNLRSTIEPDAMFNAPLNLSYIKPLASSLIADTIHISLHDKKEIIFTSYLDYDESQGKKILNTEKCYIKFVTQLAQDSNL